MLGNIGPVQLIIVLVIVLLVFGSRKLRNIGGDLGDAIKGFRKAMREDATGETKKISEQKDATFGTEAMNKGKRTEL